jgi:glyoxylase-like metal-dependent hydrolase (beta-lactamase superfamily II)
MSESKSATEQLSFRPRVFVRDSDRYGMTWRVGDVSITKIVEQEAASELQWTLPAATREALLALPWLQPHFVTPDGLGISSIHALVIATPTRRIIVDTCGGNGKDRTAWAPVLHRLQGPFLQDLEAAGYPPSSVDTVLCTHLHVDHVGWNTVLVDGRWVPTFPNARYLVTRAEYDYWELGENVIAAQSWDEIQRAAFADSVRPVREARRMDFVESTHRVCAEVSLLPTPGHSPGHVSVHISSRGEEAIITGDFTHHPAQLAHVDWGAVFDFDSQEARRTRERMFSSLADRPILVIGTHWASVSSGRIFRDGDAYRLQV